MTRTRHHDVPAGGALTKVAPGLYIDETGAEYFYLSGLYPCVAQQLAENPLLNTPGFVVDILGEIRTALAESCRLELLD